MICNYHAECILTTLNDIYYVEWFVLSWIICICNVECFFDYVERFALLLNDSFVLLLTTQWNFLLENITWKVASELSLSCRSQLWTLAHEHTPLVEIPPLIIVMQQTKKTRLSLKLKVMKIKASGIVILQNLVEYIRIAFHRTSLVCRLWRT